MFNKEEYWKNRKEKKRGQGEKLKPKIVGVGESKLGNDGEIYTPNRATRHRKPPTDSIYTKKTHKMIKERKKYALTKQQRERAIAKARKARKEAYSQIS